MLKSDYRDARTTPSLGVRHVLAPGGHLVQLWRPGGHHPRPYGLSTRPPDPATVYRYGLPVSRNLRAQGEPPSQVGAGDQNGARPAFRGRAGRDTTAIAFGSETPTGAARPAKFDPW